MILMSEYWQDKVKYFIEVYNGLLRKHRGDEKAFENNRIKWSRDLKKRHFLRNHEIKPFDEKLVMRSLYRSLFS